MTVAVITATIPGRESLLAECRASVAAQTIPVQHLVGVDRDREGPHRTRNRLAAQADADWLLPLDDDDLLDPDCAQLLQSSAAGADVVYPWCRVENSDWCPNRLFNPEALLHFNFIPVTALIRREAFEKVGGFRPVQVEDWDLWRRLLSEGARFRCVPEVLWTYRIQTGSRNQWKAAA